MESYSDIKDIRALAYNKWHFPHERQDYFYRVRESAFMYARSKISLLWKNTPINRDNEIKKLDRNLVEEIKFIYEERTDCIKRLKENLDMELKAVIDKYFWEEPVNSHDIMFDVRWWSLRLDWCRNFLAFIRLNDFIEDCSPNVPELVAYEKWKINYVFNEEVKSIEVN